jgi:hypothetical protein
MATATVTLTKNAYPNGEDTTNRHIIIFGKAVIQASTATYAAGGLALNWLQAGTLNTTATAPLWVAFQSVSGSGYVYLVNASTGKLQVFSGAAAQSPLTELTDGEAMPAGVSGDTINFRAEFNKAV